MTDALSEQPITFRTLTSPGLEAIRRHWRPFVLLQGVALVLVVAYFQSPAVRAMCEQLSNIKQQWGVLASALMASMAGVVLPELAKMVALGDRRFDPRRLSALGFALIIFAISGVIVDLQYRMMSVLYGDGSEWTTVLRKVLTDQFGTTPLYGIPYWAVLYTWRDNRYDVGRTLRQLSARWYALRVLPLLIPSWFFWIPMTLLIYSLPAPLQLWLFSFGLAAWSLVMVFIASGEGEARA